MITYIPLLDGRWGLLHARFHDDNGSYCCFSDEEVSLGSAILSGG